MSELQNRRRAIRHLIDERLPADAQADYYAFHHADFKTQIVTHRPDTAWASGYVCLARTGMDLFRPFVTFRLPGDNLDARALLHSALPPGMPVIMAVPSRSMPVIDALFEVVSAEEMSTLVLDRSRFEPIVNVLVVNETVDHRPRYLIRGDQNQVGTVAAAGLNWETRHFANVHVQSDPRHRREGYGRSVLAALVQHVLERSKTPVYSVATNNQSSVALARSVGFVDAGSRHFLVEAARRG